MREERMKTLLNNRFLTARLYDDLSGICFRHIEGHVSKYRKNIRLCLSVGRYQLVIYFWFNRESGKQTW
jgi:hypothetical protein